jgi:PAS domain S-box-containing protein
MTRVADRLVQEALLGEAAESARAAVFVCDETLRYVAVNAEACRLAGRERDELLRLRVDDLVLRPPAQLLGAAQRVADGQVRGGTSTLRRGDGSTLPVQYVSVPTTVAGLPYVLSVVW